MLDARIEEMINLTLVCKPGVGTGATLGVVPVPPLSPVAQEVIPDSSLSELLRDVSNQPEVGPARPGRPSSPRPQSDPLADG